MNIRVLRSARRSIADGFQFYENLETGLGAYFLSSIMADLRSLSIYAGIHQKYDDNYFRMVCRSFPYSVYYQIDSSTVNVFAVLDDRRDPNKTVEFLDKI